MKKVSTVKKCFAVILTLLMMINLVPMVSTAATVSYNRGVNIAGPESNSSVIPGQENTNYTFNNDATFNYFANKGLKTIRIPILWERIQPTLNGALATGYLNSLKNNITWAKSHNAKVVIDVHNYGRNAGRVIGVDANVPISSFTDLWVKLSNEFKSETGIYAYDLMNEPHGMGTGVNDWKVISQAAVTAIRNNGDNQMILVEGTSYSNAAGWESKNGSATSWITDPANNFMYSAHCYFDYNQSGTYTKTYDEELAGNRNLAYVGKARVMDFINWCTKNNVRGFIGEYGVPNNDARWNVVLENFMDTIDAYGLDGTYWAGGIWWGGYPLSVQPTNNYTTDAPQMSVLLNHLSGTVTPPTPVPSPTTPNLALSKTVTASSVEKSSTPAAYAVDGSATTRWSSQFNDNQWIYVDLGSVQNVNRVRLSWDTAYAMEYKIQVSTDATNWTDVSYQMGSIGGKEDILFPNTSARYVKMLGLQRATQFGYSLWELEVYNENNNKALNKPVTVSSVQKAGVEGAKAVDGDVATRWCSASGVDPQWIYVDLGSSQSVSRVKLNWERAYATGYKIQVSNDAQNWSDVYTTTTGDGGTDDVTYTATSGRYVRMYGTARINSTWGYSLYEMEVY